MEDIVEKNTRNSTIVKILKEAESRHNLYVPTCYYMQIKDKNILNRMFPSKDYAFLKVPNYEEADRVIWSPILGGKSLEYDSGYFPLFYCTSKFYSFEELKELYKKQNPDMSANIITYLSMIDCFNDPMPTIKLKKEDLDYYRQYHRLKKELPLELQKTREEQLEMILSKKSLEGEIKPLELFVAKSFSAPIGDPYAKPSDNEWRGFLFPSFKQYDHYGQLHCCYYDSIDISNFSFSEKEAISVMMRMLHKQLSDYSLSSQIILLKNFWKPIYELYVQNNQCFDESFDQNITEKIKKK